MMGLGLQVKLKFKLEASPSVGHMPLALGALIKIDIIRFCLWGKNLSWEAQEANAKTSLYLVVLKYSAPSPILSVMPQ